MVEEGTCLLHTTAHELAHAHQHAGAIAHIGLNAGVGHWKNTPEGKAYTEAREKDWAEDGKASYDTGRYSLLHENMAETARRFWNIRGKWDTPQCFTTIPAVKENMRNRLKWTEEWLSK